MKKIILLLALLAAPGAFAQTAGTIVLTAEITAASNGTVTPKLTWSTTPTASVCTASGGWSGTKSPGGSETLTPITTSASYKLDCTWTTSSVTLSWISATQNTDGTPLTDLKGTRIYYGTGATSPMSNKKDVALPDTTTTLTALAPGQWFFKATSYTTSGVESDFTLPVSATVGTTTANKAITLSVNIPNAPSNFTVQ